MQGTTDNHSSSRQPTRLTDYGLKLSKKGIYKLKEAQHPDMQALAKGKFVSQFKLNCATDHYSHLELVDSQALKNLKRSLS